MFEKIIEQINQGRRQQIVAFFVLWFAIYGAVWTILEPLNLSVIASKTCRWRWYFLSFTFVVNVIFYFTFFFRKKLEVLGFEAGDTDLLKNAVITGSPTLTLQADGFHGNLLRIKADHGLEPLNWNVKASANKAHFLLITFRPDNDLIFYARVRVLSKNKQNSTLKWLRFEPTMSIPQSTNDDEEMGVPVTATDDNGLNRITINLANTVASAFGRHGWKYDKLIAIRSRGSGTVKSIVMK